MLTLRRLPCRTVPVSDPTLFGMHAVVLPPQQHLLSLLLLRPVCQASPILPAMPRVRVQVSWTGSGWVRWSSRTQLRAGGGWWVVAAGPLGRMGTCVHAPDNAYLVLQP